MARLQGTTQEMFTATDHIRKTALESFDCLFTPERNLWTLQNLMRFHVLFVEGFDDGQGSFLEKLRNQLREADDDVIQLSAELVYTQQYFTTLTGPEKKIENVRTILSWCARTVPIPEWAIAGVSSGHAADQSFNQHRPNHVVWLCEYLIHWRQLTDDDRIRLLRSPWLFAKDVRQIECRHKAFQPMQEAWLFMMFPDSFENISSRNDKKRIRSAFQDRVPGVPTDNIDADLLAIRKHLSQSEGEGFRFYRPPIVEQWRTEAKALKGTAKEPPSETSPIVPKAIRADDRSIAEDLDGLAAELYLDPPGVLREWAGSA